jgi:type IX secretion system PorP/SprF family membrane protein
MKKSLLSVFVFTIAIGVAVAQQKPQYSQYVFNNLLLNPAVTGIENYTDVKAGYRSQWTGLDGAPVTSYITLSAPLGADFVRGDATAMPAYGGENPLSRLYTQNYQAAEPHHGIGFTIVSDVAGSISTTNIDANYAYHLGLSPTVNLALGVSAGFEHTSLNTAILTLENPLDPAISNGNNSQWKPDLNVGLWLYSSNYYVGASVQQVITENLYFSTNTKTYNQSKTVPHYFFTGGVKLFLADDLTLLPSVLVKFIQPVPTTFDLNLKLAFKDRFWIGGAYRKDDSFSGLVGFNLSSLINVGYSYDYTTSALRNVSNGTHEIVIGIMLNNRNKVVCPQHGF